MISIDSALNDVFQFERKLNEHYEEMMVQYRKQSGVMLTNIHVENIDMGICGVAQMLCSGKKGLIIYEYASDVEIRNKGEKYSGYLSGMMDCELHYYGMKLNMLALMFGGMVEKLVVRHFETGTDIPIRVNRVLAEHLITQITKYKVPETYAEETLPIKKVEKQTSLFA